MLRDITIGQHFPGTSLVHRFDPRMKLVLTIAYIVLLFAASNPLGLTLSILFLAVMYRVAKIPGKMILKSLKPILPIVVFTAVLNLFYTPGTYIFQWHFLHISVEGIKLAIFMVLRLMLLIIATSILTYTTSPIQLTDGLERLLSPLKKLHAPVHELSMMMCICSIFCRMIGTLEADEKRHAIWEYLKENNPGAYGAVRRSALNVGTNLPGELGRSLGISGYHLAQKVFKFN